MMRSPQRWDPSSAKDPWCSPAIDPAFRRAECCSHSGLYGRDQGIPYRDESFLGRTQSRTHAKHHAVAISAQINAAQMQLDLVSRNFAETMKKIFHRVQRLIMRHQDRPRMVRLSGEFFRWIQDLELPL